VSCIFLDKDQSGLAAHADASPSSTPLESGILLLTSKFELKQDFHETNDIRDILLLNKKSRMNAEDANLCTTCSEHL
jgi:hypothetical protein